MGTAKDFSSSTGEEIPHSEWRQGSIFQSPVLACIRYELTGSNEAKIKERRLKAGEKYIVVSHDCDIERSIDEEPFMEAILCVIEKRRDFVEKIEENRNSARWFVVDPSIGMIAKANYRVTVSRKLLPSLPAPEPWPSTSERFAWFRWWLGYRLDRPSLNRYEEDHLKTPVDNALRALQNDDPELLRSFFKAVREVRVSGPTREQKPLNFQLVMLTRSPSLTARAAQGIELFNEKVKSNIDPEQILLDEDIIVTSLQEFSVADYRQTWLLPLDHLAEGSSVQADL